MSDLAGYVGWTSSPPSEKFFGLPYIIQAPSGLSVGGPYFDPSYGVTYSDNCDFESKAIAGYAVRISNTAYFVVEQPSGQCNVTLTQIH